MSCRILRLVGWLQRTNRHGVTSQKTWIPSTTAVRTSNLSAALLVVGSRSVSHSRPAVWSSGMEHRLVFFLFNKTNKNHEFTKFYLVKKLYMGGHFLCPSSGVFYCTFGIGIFLAVLNDSCQAQSGWNWVPSWSCLEAVIKPARNIPMPNVQ